MAHAEATVTIERPVQEVFRFIADGLNNPLWREGIIEIERVEDTPEGVGAQYRQVLKGALGRHIAGDYEITVFIPNQRIEFLVIAGPARPIGRYEFKSEGGAVGVRFVLDFHPSGIARLMDGAINKQMQAEVGRLSELKKYLEADPGTA